MNFRTAVQSTPSIRQHLKSGLKALSKIDRGRLSCDGRRLHGSVAIDRALRRSHPHAARWDYAVGYGKGPRKSLVVWLEVHPASSDHIGEVLDKLHWLRQWIRNEAPQLAQIPPYFCWISTGTISFGRAGPQARRIAEAGLQFPVKHADIEQVYTRR